MQQEFCYHCEQPIPGGQLFSATVLGEARKMCCPGCQAVAQAIVENKLEDYYRFRTEPAAKADALLDDTLNQLGIFDQSQLQEEFVSFNGQHKQIQLTLEGISCAACGWLIEKQLTQLKGIVQIAVNVAARRATISWDDKQLKLSQILSAIETIGYHAMPFQPDLHEASYKKENKAFLRRLGLAGLMTMQVMMLAIGLYFSLFGHIEPETKDFFHWVSLLLTLPVVLYSGFGFYTSALKAISAGSVNMDVPISIAVWGTYIASCKATIIKSGPVYFESVCMFIFLLLVSRYLEHRSRHKAAEISANTMKHMPITATLLDEDEQQISCAAKTLKPGQRVLIKPGETVPIDGVVLSGHSQVDESMLTGEFEPVNKMEQSLVYGGTINHAGVLVVKVEKTLKQALVSQISNMQELALASKPKISMLADRLSRYFVFFVLLMAGLSFAYWSFQEQQDAFVIAIAVLVATCPCALGLATPMALTCSLAKLNRKGILIKQADLLERILGISHIAFDKTGTLTQGRFNISRQYSFSNQFNQEQLLQLCASLEAYSEHPIARAFDSKQSLLEVTEVKVETGFGLYGDINGKRYRIGSAQFVADVLNDEQKQIAANVYLADDEQLLAAYQLSDEIKTETKAVTQKLRAFQQLIISGDNEANVKAIADDLAFDDYKAQATPEQKLSYVQSLQQNGHAVMMIGDGINDSPVLAAADVSVAVGGASDLAKSAADVVLLGSQLSALPELMIMARKTQQKVRQNIAWSLGYNILVLPLAMMGLLSPWVAVIGMSLSSIIVVSNSIRLLR